MDLVMSALASLDALVFAANNSESALISNTETSSSGSTTKAASPAFSSLEKSYALSAEAARIAARALGSRINKLQNRQTIEENNLGAHQLALKEATAELEAAKQKVLSCTAKQLRSENQLRLVREEIEKLQKDREVLKEGSAALGTDPMFWSETESSDSEAAAGSKRKYPNGKTQKASTVKRAKQAANFDLLGEFFLPGTEVYYKQNKVIVQRFDPVSNTFSVLQDNKRVDLSIHDLVYVPKEGELCLLQDAHDDEKRYFPAKILKIEQLPNSRSKAVKVEVNWIDFQIKDSRQSRNLTSLLPFDPESTVAKSLKYDVVESLEAPPKFGNGYYLSKI